MVMTRTLIADDFDVVHAAFVEAFSDYVIKLSPTREQLAEMLTRRGYVPEASIGMFDDTRLVAFTLNGVERERAYDSGTGVVPTHRRRGLGRRVMEASFEVLRERGCREYVLEVIDSNRAAIELYRSLGFVERRGLQCWTYASGDGGQSHDLGGLKAAAPEEPSWQHSDASMARAQDHHLVLDGGSILFPSTGELVLRGVLTAGLLTAAAAASGKPLRILNVDERNGEVAELFEAAGATRTVRQLELVRSL